jgi:dipeptidyl aminopeptidase/acylaminoacyl peptidase
VGLARAGIAVVAPNIRGSLGYGREHALAIRGRWGEPDLDDVIAVAGSLHARRVAGRSRPIVLGHSYGAWLAVLAAARQPECWSGCVATSTFVSGRRVVGFGGPVAELVSRLGGDTGPDLRNVAGSVTTPTLVIHGELDTVVPVSEGLELAASLPAEITTFLGLSECGHDVFTSPRQRQALEAIADFCLTISRRQPAGASTTS